MDRPSSLPSERPRHDELDGADEIESSGADAFEEEACCDEAPHEDSIAEEPHDEGSGDEASRLLGYGNPPTASRFKRGQSGNPKGRPKGAKNKGIPYEAVLGRTVTVRENGQERRVTAAEALLLKLAQRGLKSGGSVAQQLAEVLQTQRERLEEQRRLEKGVTLVFVDIEAGIVNGALQDLRMGKIRDVRRPSAKMFLEPWIVTRALKRLGERRLSVEEQIEVLNATRTPYKVSWPDWWQALPEQGGQCVRVVRASRSPSGQKTR